MHLWAVPYSTHSVPLQVVFTLCAESKALVQTLFTCVGAGAPSSRHLNAIDRYLARGARPRRGVPLVPKPASATACDGCAPTMRPSLRRPASSREAYGTGLQPSVLLPTAGRVWQLPRRCRFHCARTRATRAASYGRYLADTGTIRQTKQMIGRCGDIGVFAGRNSARKSPSTGCRTMRYRQVDGVAEKID